jgi:hypothetical protein
MINHGADEANAEPPAVYTAIAVPSHAALASGADAPARSSPAADSATMES